MSTKSQQLPQWAEELVALYESDAANQFVLYGNVNDRLLIPRENQASLGSLTEFLLKVLMPRFDVILSYDVGNGIRVEKGNEIFGQWPTFRNNPELPKAPRAAVEALTHYFRYTANTAAITGQRLQIGCFVMNADLLAPALQGGLIYDLNALASLMRDWSQDAVLSRHSLATFLITENLNDLHSLIVNNSRTARIKVPLPSPDDICSLLETGVANYPVALNQFKGNLNVASSQLAGATLNSVDTLLKTSQYKKKEISSADLSILKKELVEKDCNGLIDFIESKRTLNDLYGMEKAKDWLRQDIALWNKGDLAALPMGYLLCGPVGTGKTFMMECLAGEAGVPVVKMKNFRDKWVGSTEGNLEKIFRLLQALSRCYVFIDEADQTLGRREAGSGDSGVSGRIYSMMAEEMSNTRNRGRVIWVLASSRPDLIEVDLKRPGRIDVRIPIFPTTTTRESYDLICTLFKRRGLKLSESLYETIKSSLPVMLTPGAAESLAVKVYRICGTTNKTPGRVLKECLVDYRNPVPLDILETQSRLAVREATDLEFVPNFFRHLQEP